MWKGEVMPELTLKQITAGALAFATLTTVMAGLSFQLPTQPSTPWQYIAITIILLLAAVLVNVFTIAMREPLPSVQAPIKE